MDSKLKSLILIAITFHLLIGCSVQQHYTRPEITVDPGQLKSLTSQLVLITPARNYKNTDSLNKASYLIKKQFTDFGYSPTEQEFTVSGKRYRNIIASWGPNDAPVFVIGAHYDVSGDQPGADDNASGVAGLLKLAQIVARNKPALNYRLEFVAYTLEEPPFFRTKHMGSYIHAQSLYEKKINVLGMASLEMIGFFSDKEKSQEYPISIMKLFYPTKGNFIAVVGNYKSSSLIKYFHSSIGLSSINVEKLKAPSSLAGVDFSDHMNYWKFGYKAIMITDTSFYRNKNYHMASDTIETLNFSKMAEVVKALYWSLINIQHDN